MEKIREFIIEYIESEYKLPEGYDDSFDFVKNGYVNSMRMVMFVILLEEEFNITFDDEELEKPEFKTIGGLTQMIQDKINQNG